MDKQQQQHPPYTYMYSILSGYGTRFFTDCKYTGRGIEWRAEVCLLGQMGIRQNRHSSMQTYKPCLKTAAPPCTRILEHPSHGNHSFQLSQPLPYIPLGATAATSTSPPASISDPKPPEQPPANFESNFEFPAPMNNGAPMMVSSAVRSSSSRSTSSSSSPSSDSQSSAQG